MMFQNLNAHRANSDDAEMWSSLPNLTSQHNFAKLLFSRHYVDFNL